MDVTTDWYWEGNVVDVVERYLSDRGWEIVNKANTHSKERGVDLHATKAGITLLVEAKGYPSKQYRDPGRAGEQKPTNPTNQAQHWFSHAVLKAMRLQTKHIDALVALAFPDFPRYRTLHQETRSGLEKLGVALLLVKETGDVDAWGI
jgi:Holliday junction resolvase-like predicted endonuclease